jgi:hypothetical protein
MRSDSYGPADGGGNLAEATAAKNPLRPNSTINYFNEIGMPSPVRKAGLGCSAAPAAGSAETDRFEVIVRFDDFHQPVFCGAIAAIGVRMMAFHKFLETRFDLLRGGLDIEPERIERFAFGIANLPGLGARLLFRLHTFAKKAERICLGTEIAQVGPDF